MLCVIRIVNGAPFEHPILASNFVHAFPDIDIKNLPPEYAYFNRLERPILSDDQVFEQEDPVYRLVDGVWTDVWLIRDKTQQELDQEVIEKYQLQKDFALSVLPRLTDQEDITLWNNYISDIEAAMQAPSPLTWEEIRVQLKQNGKVVLIPPPNN